MNLAAPGALLRPKKLAMPALYRDVAFMSSTVSPRMIDFVGHVSSDAMGMVLWTAPRHRAPDSAHVVMIMLANGKLGYAWLSSFVIVCAAGR